MRERLAASVDACGHMDIVEVLRVLDEWIAGHVGEFDPFNWRTPEEAETRRKAFRNSHFTRTSGPPAER